MFSVFLLPMDMFECHMNSQSIISLLNNTCVSKSVKSSKVVIFRVESIELTPQIISQQPREAEPMLI